MFFNKVLSYFQQKIAPIYQKSFFLKSIDILILLSILAVIVSSIFYNSDIIGAFAINTFILTLVKLLTKKGEKFELTLSDKFLLLYFLIVIISLAGSSLFYLSFKGFLKTITFLSFYVSLVHYFKYNYDKIKYIFLTIGLCVSIETIIAFIQHFGFVEEISGWQDVSRLNPEEVMTRVYGSLKPYNPNLFGGYLLATIPAFIALFKNFKYLSILGFIASIIALLYTGCRGAYIGLFVELIILSFFIYNRIKPKLKKIFILVAAILSSISTGIIMLIPSLHARIFSIFAMRNDSSNSFRFNVYHSCLNMLQDNFLLGIGIGNQNFREIYGLYMRTGFDALSAYNIYLEIALESGIFALISFIAFLIALIQKALLNKKSIYVICALVSITGILTHGIVDTVFFRPQIQFIFWIMVAILRGNYANKTN